MEPSIVFEDNHLLAINKPAGWLVQGDKTGDPTLTDWGKEYLRQKYQKPGAVFLHPVHRIDRPVSGIVLFARTDKALGRLTTLFRTRQVQKTYWALVVHAPKQEQGLLRHWLLKNEQKNITTASLKPGGLAKEAVLEYIYLGPLGPNFKVQVMPHTGRPHQIRVQLASMGCSILGDLKYGATEALPDASVALHARQLEFIHPVRQEPVLLQVTPPSTTWWEGF